MVLETWATALGVVGLVIGLVLAGVQWAWMPRIRRRCIVNFKDGQAAAVEGLLWGRRGRWVILRDCSLLDPTRHVPTKLDGELTIDRDAILFLQISYEPPRRG